MAWRIQDSVIRGEVDNREKGVVRGRLWLHGLPEPVVLELKGNAHPDLAGCLLKFEQPGETIPMRTDADFSPVQRGTIGDLTASRKVRVPDVPIEEFVRWPEEKGPPPEHLANCLYLEWFSEANGRVVIESADYRLDVSAPEWRLTPEDEAQRAKDAEAGWKGFMQQLNEAVETRRHKGPEKLEDWDEFDHEKSLREGDAITDKYLELLQKYGDDPNSEEIIAREMGWDKDTGAEDGDDSWDVDEINRVCAEAEKNPLQPDPLTEGKDWIQTERDDIKHPLSHRTLQSAIALMRQLDEFGLKETEDQDLVAFVSEFQITGAKLAGALDSLAYGRSLREGAFVVAYLKRALDHLHKAQAGLESVAPKRLLPDDLVAQHRRELFEIREEILRLMKEFRG
jgi:hypothetical protein